MSKTRNDRFIGFDRLKQTVTMEQVLARYGLLEQFRRSGDNLSGVCPLHQGHNPTQFRVSLAKSCWICFGDCQSGGSVLDFVARMERVSIHQAGLLLQDWFKLQPGDCNGNTAKKHPVTPKRNIIPAPKSVNPPLRLTLGPLDGSHPYLNERGLSTETIEAFGLGLCPHGTLRGWIAIPIHNATGRLIAYAGRWPGNPSEGQSKYRLPRGFHKSLELFNQHRAVIEEKHQPLVIVEGFFGCMAVWQAGHRRVVSLMGSMLSPVQEDRIVELVGDEGQAVLLLDGDAAGRKGCANARARLEKRIAVGVVCFRDGEQPDAVAPGKLLELIRQASAQAKQAVPFRPTKKVGVAP